MMRGNRSVLPLLFGLCLFSFSIQGMERMPSAHTIEHIGLPRSQELAPTTTQIDAFVLKTTLDHLFPLSLFPQKPQPLVNPVDEEQWLNSKSEKKIILETLIGAYQENRCGLRGITRLASQETVDSDIFECATCSKDLENQKKTRDLLSILAPANPSQFFGYLLASLGKKKCSLEIVQRWITPYLADESFFAQYEKHYGSLTSEDRASIIGYLIKANQKLGFKKFESELEAAVEQNNCESIIIWHKLGVKLNEYRDSTLNETLLFHATTAPMCRFLMNACNIKLATTNKAQRTALHQAIVSKKLEAAAYLRMRATFKDEETMRDKNGKTFLGSVEFLA